MKKNLIRTVSAVLLCACMAIGGAASVLAANQSEDVAVNLYTDRISYESGKDKFFDFDSVVPGDTLTQRLVIKNTTHLTATVRLSAAPKSGNEKWLELMKQIKLTVYPESNPSNVLYQGDLTGGVATIYGNTGGSLLEAKALGDIAAGATYNLILRMDVPLSLANEFATQSTQSGIQWTLNASFSGDESSASSRPILPPSRPTSNWRDTSDRSRTSGGTDRRDRDLSRSSASQATSRIPDQNIPLDEPNFTIEDIQTPLKQLPQTGGNRLPAIGVCLSCALLAGGVASKKDDED